MQKIRPEDFAAFSLLINLHNGPFSWSCFLTRGLVPPSNTFSSRLEEESCFSSVCSFQSAGSRGRHPASLQSAGEQKVSAVICCHFLYNPAINITQ